MLIGITCDHETVTDSRGLPAPRYVTPEPYVRAITTAGADPILLPHTVPERARRLLERLDGLVVAGGDFDVPPPYYGEETRPTTRKLLESRSDFERALCQAALDRGLPLLGICGGMQLLNVIFGGTLYQDLSERPDTGTHEQPQDRRQPHHPVRVAKESRLQDILGVEEVEVNSTHHQIIRQIGNGLVATAVAPDGVVEAIEAADEAFLLGVQWHPELLATPEQAAIYAALVAAARGRR